MKKAGWFEVILFAAIIFVGSLIIIPAALKESTKLLPLSSVVYIEAYEGWSGAGVVVEDGIILTAGHIIEGATGFNLEYKNGIIHSSERFYKMSDVDLGFIFVDTNDLPESSVITTV